jgi:ABC-type polysaccharide/polyol phosphate export permease
MNTAALGPGPEAAGTARLHVPHSTPGQLRVIESQPPTLRRYFADTWRLRSAFAYFVQRYARKRTGRTFFGYLWFFLPVLLPLFVGALVFGGILGVSVPGVPYFLYFAVALSAWLLFSQTAYFATRSLEISRSEVRRVYVPRLLPLTAAMTLPMVNFLVYVLIIACTVGFYVVTQGQFYLALRPATLLVLPALVMLVAFAWALGLWFSTLAPRARDVRRTAGYVLGFWYFLTPVMYPIDEIPARYQFLASLNPATTPIELIKNGLLNVGEVTTLGVAMFFGWLVVAAVGGLVIFVPKERRDMAFY